MIYALALGSNHQADVAIAQAQAALSGLGQLCYSSIHELPDRTGIGPMYLNLAALLDTSLDLPQVQKICADIEVACGRVRPSKQVRMDIDVIASGEALPNLQIVATRLPLPDDAVLPLLELWPQLKHKLQFHSSLDSAF